MVNKKKVSVNKIVKKDVKPTKKANKKVQVVSQSVKTKTKQPKGVVTTTAKVDTSTPVNKWICGYNDSDFDIIEKEEPNSGTNPLEHKMFEVDNIEKEEIKLPFWARVLWWFMK